MSDEPCAGYVVILTENLAQAEAEAVRNALQLIRGVIAVEPLLATPELMLAEKRAKIKTIGAIYQALGVINHYTLGSD